MLRDSTASEFMPKSCRLLKDSDSCTKYLSLNPCNSFLSDVKHYYQVVGLNNDSLIYCHLPWFLKSRLC